MSAWFQVRATVGPSRWHDQLPSDLSAMGASRLPPLQPLVAGLLVAWLVQRATAATGSRGSNMNKVSAEIGENVVLDCGFDFPDGVPVPYVVQWQKLDNKIPIYIW